MNRPIGAARATAHLLVALGLFGSGCRGAAKGAPAAAGVPAPQVTAVTVEPRTVALPYEFTGQLEGSREVEVRARVSGLLLERVYDEGRPVKKGETLFIIDPAPYRAAVQEAAAEVEEERARLARIIREG